jgi:hypothetical protein
MKVITEERLKEYIKTNGSGGLVYCSALLNELQEIDTLTVSKLRPMVDAPIDDETILCIGDRYNTFLKVYFDGEYYKDDHNDIYDKEYFIGWIPMPIYKPELAGNGNSEPIT